MDVDKIKIAVAGDNCMDVYDQQNMVFPGGNPVNVAVYAVRLGARASYTGAVGTDVYGQMMKNALKAKDVDISHMKVLCGSTAVTHVCLVNGERELGDYHEGVTADFHADQEDIAFFAQHDMFVTGLWGHMENVLPEIKASGVPVAFDFATACDDPIIDCAAPYTDYAFFSDDSGDEAALRIFMKTIYDKGVGHVIVTRGERGSLAFDGLNWYSCGIVRCRVVDTMGAGDSFIAGFLVEILRGGNIKEAMEAGARNSSITLGYQGAW